MAKLKTLDREDKATIQRIVNHLSYGNTVDGIYNANRGDISKATIKKWLKILADNGVVTERTERRSVMIKGQTARQKAQFETQDVSVYFSIVRYPLEDLENKIRAANAK